IKAQLGEAVPFAKHTGVILTSVAAGEASAELAQTAASINHIGTQHAGALFTLGEAASGGAMAGAFADQILLIRPVASEATIAYKKIAKGAITAHAKIAGSVEAVRADLAAKGRVSFDVDIALINEEKIDVAIMKVKWDVRKT
ncbi:MAG: YiiD C-terminal domain-containing protein, partial [Amphiplicatus sp.]